MSINFRAKDATGKASSVPENPASCSRTHTCKGWGLGAGGVSRGLSKLPEASGPKSCFNAAKASRIEHPHHSKGLHFSRLHTDAMLEEIETQNVFWLKGTELKVSTCFRFNGPQRLLAETTMAVVRTTSRCFD